MTLGIIAAMKIEAEMIIREMEGASTETVGGVTFTKGKLGKIDAVLSVCGIGALVGFFLISVVMKRLIDKYPRGTFFAIIGFIIGSLPAVYVSTMKDAGMISDGLGVISMPTSPSYYALCLFLVLVGVGASYFLKTLSDTDDE
jgi:uncharacterized membrane protein